MSEPERDDASHLLECIEGEIGEFDAMTFEERVQTRGELIAAINAFVKRRTAEAKRRERQEIESMLRDIARRIGPACTPASIRADIDKVADLLASWSAV